MNKSPRITGRRAASWLVPWAVVALATANASAQEPGCTDEWLPSPYECFPDVLCNPYAEYWDYRRAVVHISGPDLLATGVLLNNSKCHLKGTQCGRPYILTANHVVSGYMGVEMSEGEKRDLESETNFTFGLEAGLCQGGTTNGAVALSGATIVGFDVNKDLVLIELDTSLPAELGAYFVGWDIGDFDQAVSISHPCGAPKRIAISEFGEIVASWTAKRRVYDVYHWEVGALESASSGAPLLDTVDGALKGIFTDTVGAGSSACVHPDRDAKDRFTAVADVLDFIPTSIDGGLPRASHYDSNEGAPIAAVVEDANYYGTGKLVEIVAGTRVLLIDGFFADKGSTVNVRIEP